MNLLSIGRRFLCAASVVAMSATVNSCFDDSALKESIDDLNNRVGALEDFRNQVQSEIADLQEIIIRIIYSLLRLSFQWSQDFIILYLQ